MTNSTQSTFLNQPAEPIIVEDKNEEKIIPPSHIKKNKKTILWACIIFGSLLGIALMSIWALNK